MNPCSGQPMSSLLAHPTDCRKYYRCDNMGQPEELTCAGANIECRLMWRYQPAITTLNHTYSAGLKVSKKYSKKDFKK